MIKFLKSICYQSSLILGLSLTLACSKQTVLANKPINQSDSTYSIPLAGNAFITVFDGQTTERITENGLTNWKNSKTIISTYLRVHKAGNLKLSLNSKSNSGNSSIKVSVNGVSKKVDLKNGSSTTTEVGSFKVDTGYLKIDVQGIDKSGDNFGELNSFSATGDAVSMGLTYCNDPEYYYWARRGPSCHLAYIAPSNDKIQYYYSEIEVPVGSDPVGSYYMANGFSEGYFGIQVNSPTERRVLFSVWSPYSTDDPNAIPDDQKIIMNKKGTNVHTGEFGNEGSGGQSYLKYNWKAGSTYKFLLKGEPDGKGKTDYTAWFFAPEEGKWQLIASFKRPKTDKYLTGFHSFLENFSPNQGYHSRTANYKNQWVRTADGKWLKVTEAKFTVDNTYHAKQRIDAIGGKNKDGYFLKNGGFFSELVPPNSRFIFDNVQKNPEIDFSKLP
ncbi:DUF3472 domain-containing protein [Sphingobacterium cellulitidis]|uniref:DUF3472 domain-containing protein n=1 Tax=Sphingobacterium cellulitidis TaxID=1768011 RepID=UPI00370D2659